MSRSRLSKLVDWVRSRTLVGEDAHHLFFSEFIEKGKPERRYVEFKDNNLTHSSDRMAVEWWSWLHNRRDTVPTNEEVSASARALQKLAERVAILEAEDERQRLRQQNMQGTGTNTDAEDTGPSAEAAAAVLIGGGVRVGGVDSNKEEIGARRRRKALERLQNASSPGSNLGGAVVPSSKSADGERDRNIHKDPTVCYSAPFFVKWLCGHTNVIIAMGTWRLTECRVLEKIFNLVLGNRLDQVAEKREIILVQTSTGHFCDTHIKGVPYSPTISLFPSVLFTFDDLTLIDCRLIAFA